MYITTSRKPSDSTRVIARNISSFLNSTYENRGKKSVEDVVSRARLLGFRRVMVISESKGNPNKLSFISVDKGWDWMSPELLFSVATSQLKGKIGRLGKEVSVHAKKRISQTCSTSRNQPRTTQSRCRSRGTRSYSNTGRRSSPSTSRDS